MAEKYGWDSGTKLAKLVEALEDKALTFYSSLSAADMNSYRRVSLKMNDRFGPRKPPRTARSLLHAAIQKEGEELEEFSERVQMLAQDAWGASHPTLVSENALEAFLQGILDKEAAMTALDKQPESLDEAFQALEAALEAWMEEFS